MIKLIKRATIVLISSIVIFTIILQSILSISGLGLSVLDIYAQCIPKNDHVTIKYDDSFFISQKSYFEKQEKSQCGGFSSAYVMRALGNEITGKESYSQLNHKFANGYVLPQGILDIWKENDIKATLYRGNLDSLKTRLNADNPIIVLIGNGVKWQHYVTVVGYDDHNIYLYDSNKDTNNSKGYNRTMTNQEFTSQWKNEIPLFEQIYFVVE